MPSPTRSRSRLTRFQQQAVLVVVALAVVMYADTLYLLANRATEAAGLGFFAVTQTSLPRFYQAMVLGHTGVGLLLVLLVLAFVEWHLPMVWRRHRQRAIVSGAVTLVLGLGLLVTGLFILSAANHRDNRWAWWLHVAFAAGLPLGYLAHRRGSIWKPSPRSYRLVPGAVAVLTGLAVVAHVASYDEALTSAARAAFAAGTHRGPGSRLRQRPGDVGTFVPAAFVSFTSPFFPSAATTTTGDYLPARIITRGHLPEQEMIEREVEQQGFLTSHRLGAEECARCHAATVAQWATSAHRFASFNNPFYEATVDHLRQQGTAPTPAVEAHIDHFTRRVDPAHRQELAGREGPVKSKWCSGCHDPALMLAGRMAGPVDRRSPEAQAGLTCLACHAIDAVHGRTGNGDYNIADHQEDPYLFAGAEGGLTQLLHDTALKARPAVHKRQMLKPFFRAPEFCATCHKVSLDTPLNGYRWLRGQDEYDNWHDSGVARNAARTFYLPPARRVCQDCHMPLEPAVEGDVSAKGGYVHSHRFLAVNTALPYLRGDADTIRRIEAFLRAEKLRVDIAALRRADGTLTTLPDLDPPAVARGETLEVAVTVRNLGVGHTFPGGTNDSNEAWLEVTAAAADGTVLGRSGALGADGHVDAAAHFYKALLVDRQGRGIHQRNAQDIYAPVYVRVIGPGTADVARYRVVVPTEYGGRELRITVRLLWRKFDRTYTEFAYAANPAGFRPFAEVPDLPVTEIARHELVLPVAAPPPGQMHAGDSTRAETRTVPPARRAVPAGGAAAVPAWERLNDYGIGLLLQGDTRGATVAFEEVVTQAPEGLDGPRNLARAALQDGDVERAYQWLGRCETLAPGDARTAWVWAVAHQAAGRYEAAAQAYRHVLERFPQDRASWRNLGRVLYLDGRYHEALLALDQVLRIDPEDRGAHYQRMLVLRSLDRQAAAAAAEQAYQHYQIDESAQVVTRRYRMEHADANREAQAIHVHDLARPARPGVAAAGLEPGP